MTRQELIQSLCDERGGTWGDGSTATDANIAEAAQHPGSYDIDIEDLDEARRGDVGALLRLRSAWSLAAL